MDKLEKIADIKASIKPQVDHVKCCNCFSKSTCCTTKEYFFTRVLRKTASFLRRVTD